MHFSTKTRIRSATLIALALVVIAAGSALAAKFDQVPPWPNNLSPAGLRAAATLGGD